MINVHNQGVEHSQSDNNPLQEQNISCRYPKINRNKKTDILIIGAGLEGLTLGLILVEAGHRVIIIEQTEMITQNSRQQQEVLKLFPTPFSYNCMEDTYGKRKTALMVQSHQQAFKWLAAIITNKNISCDFKLINAFVTNKDNNIKLVDEYKIARKLKIAAKLHNSGGSKEVLHDFLQYPKQGIIDYNAYLNGITNHFTSEGGELFLSSKAEDITDKGATVNGFTINASKVVVTTKSDLACLSSVTAPKKGCEQFTINLKVLKSSLPYGYYKKYVQKSDTYSQPHSYNLLVAPHDLKYDWVTANMVVPYLNANPKEKEQQFIYLTEWVRMQFDEIGTRVNRYCTPMQITDDFLPFIGTCSHEENLYLFIISDTKPVVQSVLGALLLADLINGKRNKWKDIYSPLRIAHSDECQKDEVVKNSMEKAKNWLGWDISQAIDLKDGYGKIIRNGSANIALYRDHLGKLHTFNGNCMHDGSVLKWNDIENAFCCPHNDRYSPLEPLPINIRIP